MGTINFNNSNIIVDFSRFPFCFRTTRVEKFTNKLKDNCQFCEKLNNLFEKVIPHVSNYSFDNIYQNTQNHSHIILPKDSQYGLIKNIVKNLCAEYFNYDEKDFELFYQNNLNDYDVWQIGISGGIRLIGIRNLNVFSVLFIDYHHLIYPDKNHNQENYDKYTFCPMKNYERGKKNGK